MKGTLPTMRLLLVTLFTSLVAHAGAPDGWKFHAGQPGKPAVLLIHGLAASRGHWVSPSETWSIKSGHYKHWKEPKKQSGSSKLPKIKGDVRSIWISPVDKHADEEGSFWSYLVKEGFTVATWNQAPCMDTSDMPSQKCMDGDTFDAAWPSTKEALAYLGTLTREDIALVAHSRGGLLGRKLLKESNESLPAVARVRWLVTLHTPHHGSSMAGKGNELQKALGNPLKAIDLDFVPTSALRKLAKNALPDLPFGKAIDVLVTLTGLAGAKELDENGKVYKDLEANEKKRAGVKYFTFGGTSPRLAKIYARVYSDAGWDWKTSGRELLDFPGDLKAPFPEMKKGGDLLVTEKSSHFAFEDQHFTNSLNHAEVLWNKKVQKKVASLLVADPKADGEAEVASAGEGDDEDDPDDDTVVDPPEGAK